ncbi:MAG TPA: AgmX/PglI C-terminal domain-containing protein [Bdellovibrionales bacterium]|nr:AgmX/PglI C-terminal domain-containing protein [Bdellovibrionales bacterium]
MRKPGLVAALLVIGAALVLFHQPIIQLFESLFSPKDNRAVVGQIEDFHGEAEIRAPEALGAEPARKGQPIRHQDTVQTGQNSRAIVRMKNGLALELEALSSLFFEQGDYTLITFQRGQFKVIEKGTGAHDVIILKDGVLQDPEGRTIPASYLPRADADMNEEPAAAPTPQAETGDTTTLSDAYIASVIQKHTGFLNRCYAQLLSKSPQAKGEVHLTFTIQPNGSVTALRVLKSTLDDADLQKCVISVVERAQFRGFRAEPIVVNYPIYFE